MAVDSAADQGLEGGSRPAPRAADASAPDLEPRISVIVPAYREGPRIVDNLLYLTKALEQTGSSWEVIVVVDGDLQTWAAARPCATSRVRIEGYSRNRGKGFALRYGIVQAKSQPWTRPRLLVQASGRARICGRIGSCSRRGPESACGHAER